MLAVLALLACMTVSGLAAAQIRAVPSVGFKLGDDVTTVKAALKTNLDPEPMERNPAPRHNGRHQQR
jgi:hypothetical protein